MILIDTSAWIDFFRGHDPYGRCVDDLIRADQAALCGPVVTELRRGLRPRSDRGRIVRLLEGCQLLRQPDRLWDEAGELGAMLGRRGATVKTLDLLIAAYALAHSVPILTRDADFSVMRRGGLDLVLVTP